MAVRVLDPKPTPARRAAVKIADVLRQAGYTAYLAGGCVRDEVLGLVPNDYDVATDARPERVRELFGNSKFVGEAFGVVLVRLRGEEVEVATFRTEWGYSDGRRPSEVHFSDARHDAMRRDFTINGLFEDHLTNDIIDYVGGQDDLHAKRIRAIGNPDERFGEDYLRMLRAVRFAARLDFAIEPATAAAIGKHAAKLSEISRERIGQEVKWMLTGPRPAQAASMLAQLQLDGPTLLEEPKPVALPAVAGLGPGPTYPCVLAAWMIDRHAGSASGGTSKDLRSVALRQLLDVLGGWRAALCLSNDDRDSVKAIVTNLFQALTWQELPVAGRKRLLAQPVWPEFWSLLQAMHGDYNLTPLVRQMEDEAPPLIAEGVAPTRFVSGDDLIAMGRQPGPEFRRILEAVYDEQLEGRLATRPEALSWLAEHCGGART